MFYVYAIYNRSSKKIYIGQTDNLNQRLKMHNDKTFMQSYTAKIGGNWQIIYYERYEKRKDALKREKQLKSYRGREFVKKYIPV